MEESSNDISINTDSHHANIPDNGFSNLIEVVNENSNSNLSTKQENEKFSNFSNCSNRNNGLGVLNNNHLTPSIHETFTNFTNDSINSLDNSNNNDLLNNQSNIEEKSSLRSEILHLPIKFMGILRLLFKNLSLFFQRIKSLFSHWQNNGILNLRSPFDLSFYQAKKIIIYVFIFLLFIFLYKGISRLTIFLILVFIAFLLIRVISILFRQSRIRHHSITSDLIYPSELSRLLSFRTLSGNSNEQRDLMLTRFRLFLQNDSIEAFNDEQQSHGLNKETIETFPTFTFDSKKFSKKVSKCVVCLEHPKTGETLRTIPCLHFFHAKCIDQWLQKKSTCPICLFKLI